MVKDKDEKQKRVIVEIKPRCQRSKPRQKNDTKLFQEEVIEFQRNTDKWKAATEFANKNGFEFLILDEYSLGIKK